MLDDVAGHVPPPLDPLMCERMLHGLVAPDEAPAGYEGVSRLVIAAQRPAAAEEVAGVEAAVLAALTVLRERRRDVISPVIARTRRLRRFVRIKVTAVAFAGTLVGTSGLAAAGVLPDPIQHAAATVLGTVGIDVPDPVNHGQEVSDVARNTELEGREKGQAVSEAARENGRSDESHGRSDEPHGRSDESHGRSDEAHGHDGEDNGKKDEPPGQGQDHGSRNQPSGPPGEPDERGNAPVEDPAEPTEPAGPTGAGGGAGPTEPAPSDPGNGNGGPGDGNGGGNDGAKGGGNGNGGGPPA